MTGTNGCPRIADLARESWSRSERPDLELDEVVRRIFVGSEGERIRDGVVGGWSAMSDMGPDVNRVVGVELGGFAYEFWMHDADTIYDLSVQPVD